MGQVLSMIWNWVRHKARGGWNGKGDATPTPNYNNSSNELNNQLIIPSHLIDTEDIDQVLNHQSVANLAPPVPSDSIVLVVSSSLANVEDEEREDDKVRHVVAEEIMPYTTRAKEDTINTKFNGVIISVPCSISPMLTEKITSIGEYNNAHKILLVGEGDFSFSACLAVAFGFAPNIVATSLNSREFLIENYGSFPRNLKELETRGSVVMHGVDATKMAQHPHLANMKFDRITFNFPHAGFKMNGGSPKKTIQQDLVSGFLKNAKKMIEEDGEIHVTHKSNSNGRSWNIPILGNDQGLYLIEDVNFNLSKYPSYHTKYGFGGDKDFDCYPSKTYKFALC